MYFNISQLNPLRHTVILILSFFLQLCPDWQIDYESYEWKKLDPAAADTKKMVEQYLSWVGTDKGGRKFNQGKIFK